MSTVAQYVCVSVCARVTLRSAQVWYYIFGNDTYIREKTKSIYVIVSNTWRKGLGRTEFMRLKRK